MRQALPIDAGRRNAHISGRGPRSRRVMCMSRRLVPNAGIHHAPDCVRGTWYSALCSPVRWPSARPSRARSRRSRRRWTARRSPSSTIGLLLADGRSSAHLVPWGTMWTPGANWATTFDVDRDVRIEGHPLPRGKYSVWMIPAMKPDAWTVILNRAARRFHVVRPDAKDDKLAFALPADSAPHVEVLEFSFPHGDSHRQPRSRSSGAGRWCRSIWRSSRRARRSWRHTRGRATRVYEFAAPAATDGTRNPL